MIKLSDSFPKASGPIEEIPRRIAHNRKRFRSLRDLPDDEIVKALRTYTKFLIVRDPMERIVSAYIDKLEKYSKFFERIGQVRRIRDMYRDEDMGSADGKGASFKEFAHYLVDTARTGSEELNDHWDTFNNLCQPCLARYDFIGKFETVGADAEALLSSIGAPGHIRYPRWCPPTPRRWCRPSCARSAGSCASPAGGLRPGLRALRLRQEEPCGGPV